MDSYWQKLRFLHSKGLRKGLGKAGRVAAALGLVFGTFGPNPYSPVGSPAGTAEAKDLEWGDVRGVLTEEGDSTDANGFQHLPDYGRALHGLVVAPNGDVFTGGTGAEVDANGDGACGAITGATSAALIASSAVGAAVDALSTVGTTAAGTTSVTTTGCDAAAAVSPVIFRSTDGGMKWRSARIAGAAAGTTIRQVVVSPDYPSDNFVAVVFNGGAGTATTAGNGICWSTDGGLSFGATNCRTGFSTIAAAPITVTALTAGTATSSTVTTSAAHALVVGDRVTLGGLACTITGGTTAATINTTFVVVTVPTGTTFTVAVDCTGGVTDGVGSLATSILSQLDDVLWRTVALSPDFNFNDGSGELAIGGAFVAGSTVATAGVGALKAAFVATTFTDSIEGTPSSAATDVTLHLSYTYDEEPIALARIYVDGDASVAPASTYGQVRGSGGFAVLGVGERLLDDDTAVFVADRGMVAFDDDYATGGSFFASAGIAGTATGGVFRFGGTNWADKSKDKAACDTSIDSLTVAGNGSATKIVATTTPLAADPARVCRSTNEGSSWSDNNADGGDSVCDQCRIHAATDGATPVTAGTQSETRVANNRIKPEIVYYSHSGARGGVMRSTSTGSSWADTGLTNEAYVAGSPDEVDANKAFVTATVPAINAGAGLDAVWFTDTYGVGAAWQRVLRYEGTDLNLVVPGDFATAGVVWAYRSDAETDPVLRSTDGGKTFDNTAADPFENSPESKEVPKASSGRSATTLYLGGDKGHVTMTADGGATWSLLSKDFGEDIDEFDFTSDAKIFFVTGEDTDNTNKVWQTKDSGATFEQVGNAPWGTGDGTISLNITGYKPADNSGYLNLVTAAGTGTQDVYRLKMGATSWEELDIDAAEWDSAFTTSMPGQGDGVLLILWDNDATAGVPSLQVTFSPFTPAKDDYDENQGGGNERDNPLLELPAPPVTTGTMGSNSKVATGYALQTSSGGRIMELTLTKAYTGGITISSPPDNTSVSTNIGDNGVPTIFRWNSVDKVDAYQLMIGLDPALKDGTILGPVTTNLMVVSAIVAPAFPLIQGNTYYWAVRLSSTDNTGVFESPWSKINRFSVASQGAPTQPQPQLPLDNTTTPNVGPIQFSFNLPAGTVQYQIQILPLNNDGPAINLIIGDPAVVAAASYTAQPPVMGQGNYVLLPGSTYTWRVRSTSKSGAITEGDSSWGPWSEIRIFRTPKPSSFSIKLGAVGTGGVTTDTTPTLSWTDSNVSNYYYEIQVSGDPAFNQDPATATSYVYHNLVHGGISNPLNSWTVPDGAALAKGKHYWRVRQRVQATPLGPDEPGVSWSAAQSFTVQ